MAEAAGQTRAERVLAGVTKRGVAQVVAESDRLRQVLVQVQPARDGTCNLHDFHRVGEARAVVVADGSDEHLRFVLQPPKRLGVNDAIAVDLIRGAHRVGLFGVIAIRALARPSGEFAQELFALLGPRADLGM